MDPLTCYKTYISVKNHFTRPNYDYKKYCGKVKASVQSFYKRKDRFWFEKMSRTKSDKEVLDFFISNFVECNDPQTLWIGEIIKEGESNYNKWKKRNQSLSYCFEQEVKNLMSICNFDELFDIKNNRHPIILKEYLQGNVSIETMIIIDRIISYKKKFDSKIKDPVWEFVSIKIDKYSSFLNIDIFKYRKILKECVL